MGGVGAIVRFDGGSVTEAEVQRLLDEVAFRGPDGVGVWVDETVGLGQLAFWVLPEDKGEVGPYVESDLAVAADCRLDNRDELVARLQLRGDEPDVVLVAEAYRRWGEEFPRELLGDFTLIVWVRAQRRVLLARDAMGMRPLYFRHEPSRRVIAATEVGQILTQSGVRAEPDPDAMIAHLFERELSLRQSFVRGIGQVAPGEVVVVSETGDARRSRFWEPDPDTVVRLGDEAEYAEGLRELLIDSVRARCRGIAPTGLMLSGGVDSGAIAATAGWLASEGHVEPVHTYSWASDRFPEVDERARSDALVHRFDLPAVAVSVDDALPLSGWPAIGPYVGDAEQGVFTEALDALLDRARREGVGVVMSGDRGDLMTSGWVLGYPSLLRRGRLGWLADEIREQRRERDGGLARILARDVLAASWRVVVRRLRTSSDRSASMDGPSWMIASPPPSSGRLADDASIVDRWGYSRAHRLELVQATSVTRNVAWTDQLHARAGVGFADPWSDRRIAEYVLAIPQHQLMEPGEIDAKRLPRQAIAPFFAGGPGPQLTKAPPSALFLAGLEEAAPMLHGELFRGSRSAARDLIDDARFRDALHRGLATGVVPAGLWPTISLELWLRAHWG